MSDPVLSGGIVADPPIGGDVSDPVQTAGTVERQGPPGPPGKDGRDGVDGVSGVTPVERNYPIAVAAGQTVLPISPPPSDLNGLQLTVNGVAYGPPISITVSAVAVTWFGAFPLDASDDVRVRYF